MSGYPASTYGFYNKMLLPSFLLVSIVISWSFNKFLHSGWIIVIIGISILWISSMNIQLNNIIKANKLREIYLYNCKKNLLKFDLGDNPILIANIPYFLKTNYNNESVVLSNNLSTELYLFEKIEIKAYPISWRILSDSSFYPNHNIQNSLSDIPNSGNIWYYEYEEGNENAKFSKLENKKSLLIKFQEIKKHKINYHPIILRERIRLALKKLSVMEMMNK